VQEHYTSLFAASPAEAAWIHIQHAGYLRQPKMLVGQEQGNFPQLLPLVLKISTALHHPLHLKGGCGIRGALLQRHHALLQVHNPCLQDLVFGLQHTVPLVQPRKVAAVPLLPSQDLVKALLVLSLARFNHIAKRCDLTLEGRHVYSKSLLFIKKKCHTSLG